MRTAKLIPVLLENTDGEFPLAAILPVLVTKGMEFSQRIRDAGCLGRSLADGLT